MVRVQGQAWHVVSWVMWDFDCMSIVVNVAYNYNLCFIYDETENIWCPSLFIFAHLAFAILSVGDKVS